ncbi:GIY-YIG nuclease family protein [Candidatus Dojkabacteria bacterium]|nr:GIY-YIG nuclease family protein [Candidatus Dojkabacteria bacterium]
MNKVGIYIIKDIKNRIYVGSTDDIKRRLSEHNRGKSKYTKNGTEWKLVYFKKCKDLKGARSLEQKIKKSRIARDSFYVEAGIISGRSSVG